MDVKVLGTGCANCTKLYENTKAAIEELGIEADLVKVEDLKDILTLGVMTTPSIMINGKLKSNGQVLSKDRIIKILKEYI